MDDQKLLERMRRVEALYARTDVPGERAAAGHALELIMEQLRRQREIDPPIEYRFSLSDLWSRRLFMALARRYQLEPYRYPGQRRNTVMLRVSKTFLDQTLWPEFRELSQLLQSHLGAVTDRIIREALNSSGSDETAVANSIAGALPGPDVRDDSV